MVYKKFTNWTKKFFLFQMYFIIQSSNFNFVVLFFYDNEKALYKKKNVNSKLTLQTLIVVTIPKSKRI
jgi:hypothetical protein